MAPAESSAPGAAGPAAPSRELPALATGASTGTPPAAREPRGVPLFLRLWALALAAGLVPVAALGFAVLEVNRDALRNSARTLHLALASDVRRAIRGELARVEEELVGIGQLLLAPGLGDDDRRLALAGAKVTASGAFDHVTLYEPGGARAGTIKATEAADPSSEPALDEPLRTALAAGRLVTGTPKGALGAGAGGAIAEPRLPLFRGVAVDGVVKGLLATDMRLAGLCALVAELGERRLGARDAVLVVDESLSLVVAGDPARVAVRERLAGRGIFAAVGPGSFAADYGAAPEFEEDGVPMLGALEPMPELRWAVIVRQRRDLAYASLAVVRRSIAAAGAGAALVALLGAALVARRLARPIGALAAATADVARRRYRGVGRSVTARRDEIGRLGRAFDRMAHDLDASERRAVEEATARASLSRYLPGDVVDLVLADPARLKLGGDRREVTVLFADVVAFTRLSETLAPERVVGLLNELFTIATEIVHRHRGIVDKFMGDCVMAVWGAPEPAPDDAVRAVRAAGDLRRWVETANRKWRADLGAEIRIAMGINTGPAVAGNVGSEKRMEYTVVGDAVNVAARLETMAAPGQILLSDATRARLGEAFALRVVGERELFGRRAKTLVYEVPA